MFFRVGEEREKEERRMRKEYRGIFVRACPKLLSPTATSSN